MNNKIIKLDGADWTKSEIQTLIDSIKKGLAIMMFHMMNLKTLSTLTICSISH